MRRIERVQILGALSLALLGCSEDGVNVSRDELNVGGETVTVNGNVFQKVRQVTDFVQGGPAESVVAPANTLAPDDIFKTAARMLRGNTEYVLSEPGPAPSALPTERRTPPGMPSSEARNDPSGNVDVTRSAVIVGTDQRFRSPSTTTFPFRTAFKVLYTGRAGSCSGAMIGPHTGASAAHCFFQNNQWYAVDGIAPGADSMNSGNYPFGVFCYTVIIPGSYHTPDDGNDIAIVDFTGCGSPGTQTGWLGTVVRSFTDDLVGVPGQRSGYDGDKQGAGDLAQQWTSNVGGIWPGCYDVWGAPYDCKWLSHGLDTTAGASGSAVYVNSGSDQFCVVGIHTAGVRNLPFANANSATHWIASVFQFFHQYAVSWP